ncbi:putative ABC transporter permease protein YurM [Vallitalea longa]|uniref:ABC transporter permease protein YurM n=1 Tax=Vallitalea longa TaxID=2936439 RepID=A0A9W5YF14_9FIRM|nr:carbohydrate ABC transporter permease [Vallitalea longa]GKX31526.1 putative ABC transporter permease protein YurM [Vallitalea longa]
MLANESVQINNTKKNKILSVLLNIFFIILVISIFLPLIWLLINSLKSNNELFNNSLALPSKWLFSNYAEAWGKGLFSYFKNSLIVSSASLILIITISALLAYGLTRFHVKGGNIIFFIILGGMALSEQVALVPLYKMLQAMNLYNTYFAVILPYIAFRIPFTVFLMRAYFITIPKELEEAAYIDGYNSFQIFYKIIVPISKPVFASCAIVNLNFVWNEFLFANVFLESKEIMTIPIGLMTFQGDMKANYTVMLAGIVIASIPMILIFLSMQKQFIRGLTAGSVKG